MADTPQHKTKILVWLALLVALIVLLLAYLVMPRQKPFEPVLSKDDFAPGASFVNWFELGHEDAGWYRSDFDNVDHFMQVGWAEDHALFGADGLSLLISDQPSETNEYTAGEYQRKSRYGFGRYEVIMRAATGSGLVSSFFTHTGPYFGDPHDEIDFEILGKDTRRVYLNWFRDGEGGTPLWHDLGFDAAADFHLYAFDWTPETIRWYVDGVLVYERPEDATPVPQTPGRIIANLWTGLPSQYDWHGTPDFSVPASAAYQCMSYRSPEDTQTPRCSDNWQTGNLPTDEDRIDGRSLRRVLAPINRN